MTRDNMQMRLVAVTAALLTTGCSFVLTKGPGAVPVGTDPAKVDCTTSTVLPSIDAIGGAGTIAASAGGTLYEIVSPDPAFENFKYYYALPLLALGVVYMWSASHGTDNVTSCQALKDKEDQPTLWQVQPIDTNTPQRKDDEKPPTLDDVTP